MSTRRRDVPATRSGVPQRRLAPAELFVGSFLLLTIAGTLAFKLLPGLYRGAELGWEDAAFTATSAVCVTGLIVVDTATHFTFAGQALILLLIQLGGLGMLALTSMVITALGGRPSLRSESLAVGSRQAVPHIAIRRLIVDIVRFTLLFEGIGAILLYAMWAPQLGWHNAIWPAIFHSVSAFCNAGFSTYSDSLVGFQQAPVTLLVISLLIIAGGLGFVTMEELHQLFRRDSKKQVPRLSVHSRIVLIATVLLTVGGWLLFAAFEWNNTLNHLPIVHKLSNSFFMSVTARTAGFNTVNYAQVTDSAGFLTIMLMMVGGSPGSTAGGIKTTTFALLGLLAWSRLRSRSTVTFAHRSIPAETIQRATGLFVIATGVVVIGVLFLTSMGDLLGAQERFMVLFFEVVSAFNTVGLSMGATSNLAAPSHWLIIVLMFAGRTGPLAIAAALVVRFSQRGRFRLAYEDVIVG